RLRERLPRRLVEPLARGLQALQTVVGRMIAENLLRQLAERVLILREIEVHIPSDGGARRAPPVVPVRAALARRAPMGASAPAAPRHQRALGIPRPAMAMISRCTSFVPPPNVRIGAWPR